MKYNSCKYFFLLVTFLVLFGGKAMAQQEGFIFGEIILRNNSQYKGKITWSAGQSMWVDMLTVEKKDNPMLKYLTQEELQKLSEVEKNKTDWGFMNLWKNHYPNRKLTFRCQFGNITKIEVTGSQDATISLKNDKNIRAFINDDIEYKDQLGQSILIHTMDDEKNEIEWNQIREIRFSTTPAQLPQFMDLPLYGTVLTRFDFTYTGMIKWDMDEHLSTQYLDGRTIDNKSARYHFYDVQSVRPKNEGSIVQLKSGKEIYLHEFTNVTNKNAGILIRSPKWGQVNLRWGGFKNATFIPYPPGSGFGYDDFPKPKELRGTITTKANQDIKGSLVFDLDERWDMETLDGWDQGGGLRQIPFRLIDHIYPVSETHSAIFLRDGEKITLGDRSDVNHQNWGIMVKMDEGEFQYIPWKEVQLLHLSH